jgi:xylulokinase
VTVPLVAGVDSSTQACTVVLRDADNGRIVATSEAPHPPAAPPVSEQAPGAWWEALCAAARQLDLRQVAAVSVDGQGHGLVALDNARHVIRPAKLWNDTSAAVEARELVARLGAVEWARRTGIVPVSAITIAKLLWLARHEPDNFRRLAAVALPPDYLNLCLTGNLVTDRSEASGTGYLDSRTSAWDIGLLALVDDGVDWLPRLPHVAGPCERAGVVSREAAAATGLPRGISVGPGANDQPVNALSLGTVDRDVIFSLATSGTVSARSLVPVADPSGVVTGVADATGAYMPCAPTLNATRVTDAFARLLGVDYAEMARLALAAPGDPDRPIVIPYFDGERTPDRPNARGSLVGLRPDASPQQVARASFEGVLCGLMEGLDVLESLGVPTDGRLVLAGGGSNSPAYRQLLADLANRPVFACDLSETSASGAAVQAAAVLHGIPVQDVARAWAPELRVVAEPRGGQAPEELRARYRRLAGVEGLDVWD